MPGEIASAVHDVATAVDKTAESGSMGIRGFIWTNISQMTFGAIIAGSFLYIQREQIIQSREKDVIFREAITSMNSAAEKRFDRAEQIHGKTFEKFGDRIEKIVASSDAQTAAVKEATVEMKETSKELKNAVKVMTSKGP